jgi:alpha-beta hydrolase superfamily lysophospholipase
MRDRDSVDTAETSILKGRQRLKKPPRPQKQSSVDKRSSLDKRASADKRPGIDKPLGHPVHRAAFGVVITSIGRFLDIRDRVFGWVDSGYFEHETGERATRHAIASGASRLDAVFVEPAGGKAHTAVLLCHGIGETVKQWYGVQQLLAVNGVASLVFDYSGYGKSRGRAHWNQFERDAMAAFAALEHLAQGLPLSVVGFSLGSGVAVATINQLCAGRESGALRLVLCEAFTSFRGAAKAAWFPKPLTKLVPPIWHAQEPLASCGVPVLIVHGEKDTLFPVRMAHDLAGFCAAKAHVVLVPDTAHNQPFRKPHLDYWGPVIDWVSR